MRRREDLSSPRRGLSLGIHYDPEAFGEFSETIARFIGTARFLVGQTVVVFVWIVVNAAISGADFDPYPFILLTLALSLQAAYAAPLILLAQNRQAERDRQEVETDRVTSARDAGRRRIPRARGGLDPLVHGRRAHERGPRAGGGRAHRSDPANRATAARAAEGTAGRVRRRAGCDAVVASRSDAIS